MPARGGLSRLLMPGTWVMKAGGHMGQLGESLLGGGLPHPLPQLWWQPLHRHADTACCNICLRTTQHWQVFSLSPSLLTPHW